MANLETSGASGAEGRPRLGSVVVTGASSGVGRALALELAAGADELALIGRDRERLDDVACAARARGARASCFPVDLASANAVSRLADSLRLSLPRIALLVHAAGVFVSGDVSSTEPAAFELALDVNLRAPYLLTRELIRPLAAGPGDVVFINSSVVGQRRAGLAAYAASKQGLLALADSLRQEVNPLGIRVLSVFLGATDTPMQQRIYADQGRAYDPKALLAPSDVARVVRDALAMGRGAEVTDIHIRPALPHRS